LARIVFVRALALVYLVAFCVALNQNKALIGPGGLTPANAYLQRVRSAVGDRADGGPPATLEAAVALLGRVPTLLWFTGAGEAALDGVALAGAALSAVVLVAGGANSIAMLTLWGLYHRCGSTVTV
jgi:hypothetical protein